MATRAARLISSERPHLGGIARAELACIGWECVSALIFAVAIDPALFADPRPVVIFVAFLGVSAMLAPRIVAGGRVGLLAGDALRAVAWAASVAPVVAVTGRNALLGAGAFGLMAGGVRHAIYRHTHDRTRGEIGIDELRDSLTDRLAESTFVVGVIAGHALMLFLVAFLQTTNDQIRSAWWQILPWLTIGGTFAFTMAVRQATAPVLQALAAASHGNADEALLRDGLGRARHLPTRLALINFGVWLGSASLGTFGFRNLFGWTPMQAAMVLALSALFAWGISFYQRSWHVEIVAPVREWLGVRAPRATDDRPDESHPDDDGSASLRRRMLVDFGMPLVYSCVLSLVSSLGLYFVLVGPSEATFGQVVALTGSFVVLVVAAGGITARAARELSRPMSVLAHAADDVARGQLGARVPPVEGPREVRGLGDSLERMRGALARTIAELEAERSGLEEKVIHRTSELSHALAELKEAQTALLHGEKMASLGQLVAGVAHEINNPLAAIGGSIAPMADRAADVRRVCDAYARHEHELPEAARREIDAVKAEAELDAALDDLRNIAKVVRRSSDRAGTIVRNLLSFSRASSDRAPTDLRRGLEETLTLLGPQLERSGIRVETALGSLPEVLVKADEMNQVFMNLLTNAVQALTGRAPAAIRVETTAVAEAIIVAVEDDGPGVPAPLRARIFDPFFTTKPAGTGTGLGLSISRQIVARHGGTLHLEIPASGRGARFVVRLPRGAASLRAPQPLT